MKPSIVFSGDKVYKYCPERQFAEDLLSGRPWITTIDTCRSYEHPLQGDAGEAIHEFINCSLTGGSEDIHFVEMAKELGIHIGPGGKNFTVRSRHAKMQLRDAYIYCTSGMHSPSSMAEPFGRYCVEIRYPDKFFLEVTKIIQSMTTLRSACIGQVAYIDRKFVNVTAPGNIGRHLGFFKPPDPYAEQREVRMLWDAGPTINIEPFKLPNSDIGSLCRLLSPRKKRKKAMLIEDGEEKQISCAEELVATNQSSAIHL